MHVVRRTLSTAAITGLLVFAPTGAAAWAAGGAITPRAVPAPGASPGTTTDCGQVNDGGTASPPPGGVVCIASGLNPGATSGAGAPQQLPRTGPSKLVPTLATGLGLVLLGALATFVGRRRTATV